MDPAGRREYESKFYQQSINPQIEQMKADMYSNGQSMGSYGGAMVGQTAAQGQLAKYQAGLDYAQQLFNDQLAGRSSYFQGGPTVAAQQNAATAQRDLAVHQLMTSQAKNYNDYQLGLSGMANNYNIDRYGMWNNYDLGSAGMHNNYNLQSSGQQNSFNAQNYGTQMQGYGISQNSANNMFGGIGSSLSSIFGGGSGLFGGSGGGLLGGGGGGVGTHWYLPSGGGLSPLAAGAQSGLNLAMGGII